MNVRISTQTEVVAGGRRAASSQPRHATAGLLLSLCLSKRPRPHPPVSATRTIGAPQKGLLFAPLAARSRKRKIVVSKPPIEPPPRRSL